MLAPTEILAQQHYQTFLSYVGPMGIRVARLTSQVTSQGRKQRQEILSQLSSGDLKLIIGTHALLEPDVVFKNLTLVIIDEQHRFGVQQRLELIQKGLFCSCLYLSATPIPRTLLLASHGDLDISCIREKPANRQAVVTCVRKLEALTHVVARLKERLCGDEQAFWVCPLVESSEKVDLAAAAVRFAFLKEHFGDRVGLLHGRMKSEEKRSVLEAFRRQELKLLVTTTVIEVGVDVPSAIFMIIEHAERFGLAQLHQLRGRVGRGERGGVCLLLYASPLSQVGYRRLQALRDTADGFELAELDLTLRGGGDVSGVRQSGENIFRLGDIVAASPLIEEAQSIAETFIRKHPHWKESAQNPIKILLQLFDRERFVAKAFSAKAAG